MRSTAQFLLMAVILATGSLTFADPPEPVTPGPSPLDSARSFDATGPSNNYESSELTRMENSNAFLDTPDTKLLQGNVFMEGEGLTYESSNNSFLGTPESVDTLGAYSRDLGIEAEGEDQQNLFIGEHGNDDGAYYFSSEYQKLADKFWGKPKK